MKAEIRSVTYPRSLPDVQRVLGHSDLATTAIYLTPTDSVRLLRDDPRR